MMKYIVMLTTSCVLLAAAGSRIAGFMPAAPALQGTGERFISIDDAPGMNIREAMRSVPGMEEHFVRDIGEDAIEVDAAAMMRNLAPEQKQQLESLGFSGDSMPTEVISPMFRLRNAGRKGHAAFNTALATYADTRGTLADSKVMLTWGPAAVVFVVVAGGIAAWRARKRKLLRLCVNTLLHAPRLAFPLIGLAALPVLFLDRANLWAAWGWFPLWFPAAVYLAGTVARKYIDTSFLFRTHLLSTFIPLALQVLLIHAALRWVLF